MNATQLLRYLKGYVTFEGRGGFTERFINLCSLGDILIWDVSYGESKLQGKCSCRDYRRLRHIAKKSGVNLSLRNKEGFFFALSAKKDRAGLLVGAVFFLLFFSLMSRFVWTVDVSGNIKISSQDITEYAESYGLKIGTYKPIFDEVKAAHTMAENSDGTFSWVAINIKGSRAVIEVREQKPSIKSSTVKEPCNIVSSFDGTILSAEVFSGTGNILTGIGVKKGDLLISGAELNEDLSVSFVEADGKITALHEKSSGISFNKKAGVYTFRSIRKIPELSVFAIKVPLGFAFSKNDGCFTYEEHLSYNRLRLPVSVTFTTNYRKEKATRSDRETFLSSLEKFTNESYKLNKNTLLLSTQSEIYETEDRLYFKNTWNCIDFIGEKQIIQIEN